jgi:hypothetical protein
VIDRLGTRADLQLVATSPHYGRYSEHRDDTAYRQKQSHQAGVDFVLRFSRNCIPKFFSDGQHVISDEEALLSCFVSFASMTTTPPSPIATQPRQRKTLAPHLN